jgi:hypothetical protein
MTKGETLKLCVVAPTATAVEFRFGGPETRTVAATNDGNVWRIATSTAAWIAGVIRWQAWATDTDGSVWVVDDGTFDLKDPLDIGDVRDPARVIVEKIEAMISGNASAGVRRYKINNRELERYSVGELLQLLSYWKERARRERGNGGLGPRLSIRF